METGVLFFYYYYVLNRVCILMIQNSAKVWKGSGWEVSPHPRPLPAWSSHLSYLHLDSHLESITSSFLFWQENTNYVLISPSPSSPFHIKCTNYTHWSRLLASVVSDSVRPCGLWPAGLFCPRDSPGKNTGVGCHTLLPGIFPTQDWTCVSYISCIGRCVLYHQYHLGKAYSRSIFCLTI